MTWVWWALLGVVVALDGWATVRLVRAPHLEPRQRWLQGAAIWLFPPIGALTVGLLHAPPPPLRIPGDATVWPGGTMDGSVVDWAAGDGGGGDCGGGGHGGGD